MYELSVPPCVYDLSEINITLGTIIITIKEDNITMDAELKLNKILRFNEALFCHLI